MTGTPAKIVSSIAGRPSLVPGILMKRLARSAWRWSSLAAATVPAVSFASKGETSNDTQPSTPSVLFVNRRKQIGGLPEVLQRQLEEQRLA